MLKWLRVWLVKQALRVLRSGDVERLFNPENIETTNRILKILRRDGCERMFLAEHIESGLIFYIHETEINPEVVRVIPYRHGHGSNFPSVGKAYELEKKLLLGDPDAPEPQGEISPS